MEHLSIQRSSKYLTSHKVQIQSDTPLPFNLIHTAVFSNPGDGEGTVNIHSSALLPLHLGGLSCVEETLLTACLCQIVMYVFFLISLNNSGLLNP